jgi:hypothetical protein
VKTLHQSGKAAGLAIDQLHDGGYKRIGAVRHAANFLTGHIFKKTHNFSFKKLRRKP